jgi:hypothetical protein
LNEFASDTVKNTVSAECFWITIAWLGVYIRRRQSAASRPKISLNSEPQLVSAIGRICTISPEKYPANFTSDAALHGQWKIGLPCRHVVEYQTKLQKATK